jgi:23S rRNA U2552 (ribose-2'-O)-methylase RlmE/FtsJ
MEKKIIFTTKGNMSPEAIKTLEENNVIVIEVDDLTALKTINEIDNDIILESAMETIKEAVDHTKGNFFNKFFVKHLKSKDESKDKSAIKS